MSLYVILQCAHCSMFQQKQHAKTLKFRCPICSQEQSVQKIYGQSTNPRDLTKIVQELNMKQGEVDWVTERQEEGRKTNAQKFQERQQIYQEITQSKQLREGAGGSGATSDIAPAGIWDRFTEDLSQKKNVDPAQNTSTRPSMFSTTPMPNCYDGISSSTSSNGITPSRGTYSNNNQHQPQTGDDAKNPRHYSSTIRCDTNTRSSSASNSSYNRVDHNQVSSPMCRDRDRNYARSIPSRDRDCLDNDSQSKSDLVSAAHNTYSLKSSSMINPGSSNKQSHTVPPPTRSLYNKTNCIPTRPKPPILPNCNNPNPIPPPTLLSLQQTPQEEPSVPSTTQTDEGKNSARIKKLSKWDAFM